MWVSIIYARLVELILCATACQMVLHSLPYFTDKPMTSVRAQAGQGNPLEGTDYRLVRDVDDARPVPADDSFRWLLDGNQLSETSDTLTQTLVRGQHDWAYTCAATNLAGTGDISAEYLFQVFCKSDSVV